MISLCIPTLWKYKPLVNFLESIVQIPVIGEIHIINNHVTNTPNADVLKHSKIRMHNQEKNIGVNPAWNLAVRNSDSENICFMNDDTIFDLKLFFEVDKFLNSKPDSDVGIIAINIPYKLYELQSSKMTQISIDDMDQLNINGIIEFNQTDLQGPLHGCLFFIKKNNWVEIPRQLIKDFGDCWAWYTQRDLGRKNYSIKNLFFYTPSSWTNECKDGIFDMNGLVIDDGLENLENLRKLIGEWRNINNIPEVSTP
jgi:hypothetical protein